MKSIRAALRFHSHTENGKEAVTDEAKQAFGNDRQLSDPGNAIRSVACTYVIVAFIFKYISTSSADIHSFDFTVVRYYTYPYRI